MRRYTIDFDIFKMLRRCPAVERGDTCGELPIQWRLSPNRGGFHFVWWCPKKRCKICSRIEHKFDDPLRYRRDKNRPPEERRVLWQSKGGRKAGKWHSVNLLPRINNGALRGNN